MSDIQLTCKWRPVKSSLSFSALSVCCFRALISAQPFLQKREQAYVSHKILKVLFKLHANNSLKRRHRYIYFQTLKGKTFILEVTSSPTNMAFPQVIALFLALFDVIGLPGNLLVMVVIVLESRFHVMRYILLASLAVSDLLFLILVNSFRIASIAQERWLYGETMCHLHAFCVRYFYINTVLHLMAVSYDRYQSIVRSPLTYDGMITKSRMAFVVLIWLIPIVPLSIGPLLGRSNFVNNPELFFCQQRWVGQSGSSGWHTVFAIAFLAVPFVVIAILNWSVYKTAKTHINGAVVQLGHLDGTESQQEETPRQGRERKAAVDVLYIIAAFMLCYLPTWVVGILRQMVESIEVPAEAVLITSSIFMANTLCNPIIYSIRKREFRTGVKSVFRRIGGLCGNGVHIDNNVIG